MASARACASQVRSRPDWSRAAGVRRRVLSVPANRPRIDVGDARPRPGPAGDARARGCEPAGDECERAGRYDSRPLLRDEQAPCRPRVRSCSTDDRSTGRSDRDSSLDDRRCSCGESGPFRHGSSPGRYPAPDPGCRLCRRVRRAPISIVALRGGTHVATAEAISQTVASREARRTPPHL